MTIQQIGFILAELILQITDELLRAKEECGSMQAQISSMTKEMVAKDTQLSEQEKEIGELQESLSQVTTRQPSWPLCALMRS